LSGKAFENVRFNERREIKFVKSELKVVIFVVRVLGQRCVGHFADRMRFDREGFCDILREIDLAVWNLSSPSVERLRIECSSCCRRLLKSSMKKIEELPLPRFFYSHH